MLTAANYSALITAEHRDNPKFSALVESVAGCFAATTNAIKSIPASFDLDDAVGVQLDAVGLWVGMSRHIRIPFAVYFSFDIDGLGFDEGSIKGPFDPSEGVTTLDDETFRTMIRAKIGANNWDGTLPSWQSVMNQVFVGTGSLAFAVDNQDMSMDVYIGGAWPVAIMSALLKNGYLPIKPSGVKINGYTKASENGGPVFGFDVQNQYISGFDSGSFGIPL